MGAPALIVFYVPPFLPRMRALDIAPEHVEVFRDRLQRGAFVPRMLHLARPDCFRDATPEEVRMLRAIGSEPTHVHGWYLFSPLDLDASALARLASGVQ